MDRQEIPIPPEAQPPTARRLRTRRRGLIAGGFVVLGIGAIYAGGVARILWTAPHHAAARGVAVRVILLGTFMFICIAISIHLFRLASASGAIRDKRS